MKLFLVESPFQLLCAIEADNYFVEDNESCFLLLNLYGNENLNQLNWIINKYQITDFIILDYSGYSAFKAIPGILSNVRKIQKKYSFSRVFLCDYRSKYLNLVINKLELHEKLTLLDDGNTNYVLFQNLDQKREHIKQPGLLKRLAYRLYGYDYHYYLPKEIFSFFGNDFKDVHGGIKVYNNNFSFFKKSLNGSIKTINNIDFLGAKFVEIGYLDESYYINLVKGIKEMLTKEYPDSAIRYIPHREESAIKLKKLEEVARIEIVWLRKPFEIYLLESQELPSVVASFYSGALNTTKLLFDDTISVLAFRFDCGKLIIKENSKSIRKTIESSYLNLRNSGVKVIDLVSN